jgi:hypothetical protein
MDDVDWVSAAGLSERRFDEAPQSPAIDAICADFPASRGPCLLPARRGQ